MKLTKNTKRIYNILSQFNIELSIFIFLVFSLIFSVSPEINGWVGVWYGADYSIGFSSRLLIGSLLHLLYGSFVSNEAAYHFIVVCFLIIFMMLSILIGQAVKHASTSVQKLSLLILAAIYMASPASVGYLWTIENMGRLETYLLLTTLIIMLVSIYVSKAIIIIPIYTIIAILSIATHQIYFFLFFPVLLIIYIEDIFQLQFRKQYLIGAIVSVCLIGITFLFFQFGTSICYDDPTVLTEYIQSKTSVPLSDGPIIQEYFWEFKQHIIQNMLPDLRYRIRYGVITIFLLSPVLIILGIFWRNVLKSTSAIYKSKYIIMLLTNLFYVPVFSLLTDWGRWFGGFFTVQFLVIFLLSARKDEAVLDSLERLGALIKKHPAVFLCMILYLATFEKFEGCNNLNQAENFYHMAYNLKELLFSIF